MGAETTPRPILVSLPHASAIVPEEVQGIVALSKEELLGYTDLYTDQIYTVDDVYVVQCPVSRMVVDVNRAPDDISKEHQMAAGGVTVLTTWDGKEVYREEPTQAQVESLIQKYHEPFHAQIDELIPKVQFLFDCHSYLPIGPKLRPDSGQPRPDFNLGNLHFSTCSQGHTAFVRDFFRELGYTVEINFPYMGRYIIGHHCHRRRMPPFLVPGMGIEINQGLYVEPDSRKPIPARVAEFHSIFEKLIDVFVKQFCP